MKFPDIHNLETIDKRYLGKLSPKGLNFMKQVLRMEPSDRLTAIDALKHPYFDGIREDDFLRKLSSNNYLRPEGKTGQMHASCRNEEPRTVHHDRKKQPTQMYNPASHDREKTEEGSEFSRSTKVTILSKKQKEDAFTRMLHSKGFNGHGNGHNSKSVTKGGGKMTHKQAKEKNISLEKHQNRDIITKTQTGFYIMTNGGVISEKE